LSNTKKALLRFPACQNNLSFFAKEKKMLTVNLLFVGSTLYRSFATRVSQFKIRHYLSHW